jgi:hypothetical protein
LTKSKSPPTPDDGPKNLLEEWMNPPPSIFWRLDENHTPVRCETFEEYFAWGRECGESGAGFPPHIGYTHIGNGEGVLISTVFLVSPAGVGIIENPLFFETMVFGGPLDQLQTRYPTWDEAAAGHQRICEEVRKLLALSPEELKAQMDQRAKGRFRFIREQALAIGLPEHIADQLGRVVSLSRYRKRRKR